MARDAALALSLASVHTITSHRYGGEFISQIDPPEALREAADSCENIGAWPVLVGRVGESVAMLASPIILDDYPAIAPESPGDYFDCTEVDEILTLRVLTLTDDEKRTMRETDPRSRTLLDRTESLSEDDLLRLHGVVRSRRGDSLRRGDRVSLRPRDRGDVFDVTLRGMSATISSIEQDFEGRTFFAVTIDEDPGKDLGAEGKPGHRFFFHADEVEPLP